MDIFILIIGLFIECYAVYIYIVPLLQPKEFKLFYFFLFGGICLLLLPSYLTISLAKSILLYITYIAILSLLFYFEKISVKETLKSSIALITLLAFSRFICSDFSYFDASNSGNRWYDTVYVIIYLLSKFIFLINSISYRQIFNEAKITNFRLDNYEISISASYFCVYCILLSISKSLSIMVYNPIIEKIVLEIIVIVFVMIILLYIMLKQMIIRNRNIIIASRHIQQEEDRINYYVTLLEKDETQRIMLHDMKNHLLALSALNSTHNPDRVEAYILKLIKIASDSAPHVYSDNDLLNSIIFRYHKEAKKNKISFNADIRSSALNFMDDNDLVSLLGNILDNAIESCCNQINGFIELLISTQEELGIAKIKLVNSSNQPPKYANNQIITSKKDIKHHGIGMKSVERIVHKYNGEIHTHYNESDKTFHTMIVVNGGHYENSNMR